MKAEIQKMIERHVYTVSDSLEVSDGLGGQSIAAEEIQQLMCYREVKAIIDWIGHEYFVPDYEEPLIEQLEKSYDSDLVNKAIEQYKSEQK